MKIRIGDRVRITAGDFTGEWGVVTRKSDFKLHYLGRLWRVELPDRRWDVLHTSELEKPPRYRTFADNIPETMRRKPF